MSLSLYYLIRGSGSSKKVGPSTRENRGGSAAGLGRNTTREILLPAGADFQHDGLDCIEVGQPEGMKFHSWTQPLIPILIETLDPLPSKSLIFVDITKHLSGHQIA